MDSPAALTLSSAETCHVVGCSFRMLDHWTRAGVVSPHVPANGQGTARRWSLDDLAQVALVAQLSTAGLTSPAIRLALDLVDAAAPLGPEALLVVVDGKPRVYESFDAFAPEVCSTGLAATVICPEAVRDTITGRLDGFRASR